MTEKVAKSKKRRAILPLSTRQTLFCVAATVALALTYMHSDVATASMAKAIDICIYSLIPSLFPFMVLSELLVSFGATSLIAKLAGRAFRFLFGISPAGAGAFIPGVLCGFPIGTRIALSLFERGEIDRRSLSHLLCFCNCPSPAFLIGAVGIGVFGSKKFGLLLFFCELISSVILGIVFRLRFGSCAEYSPRSPAPVQDRGFCKIIVSAVKSSTDAMLSICSFVIFFSALGATVQVYLAAMPLPDSAASLIRGIFELTGGVFSLSLADASAPLFAAAIIGWSGLSIHFQFVSICAETKINVLSYFLSKILRSLLDVCIIFVLLQLFPCDFGSDTSAFLPVPYAPHLLSAIPLAVFTASAISLLKKSKKG